MSSAARSAVSVARRLQDPLAELVKIDPKLIGVGQYQHDVDQKELHRGLSQTVQACVNEVGVDANAAAPSLLRYVAGLNDRLARKIVSHREANGPFTSRAAVFQVPGLEEPSCEQAGGFLRVREGENPLDRTAIRPCDYSIVERMAASQGVAVTELIGNAERIGAIKLEDFVGEEVGLPTLEDIREELLHPGRDPRKAFTAPKYRADVGQVGDLKEGMVLEGIVTNVTNFGAFVDIGIRQDGLVHLSQMSNRFIRDPREAVRVGDIVQVKVISIEAETKRIGLSMKALLPELPRRRKRLPNRRPRPAPARQVPAADPSEATAAPAEGAPLAGSAPQERRRRPSGRPSGRPRRPRREERNPAPQPPAEVVTKTEESAQSPVPEPEPAGPEPSLQDKIALLQSKFKGIK